MVFISGMMVAHMKVNGERTKSQAWESIVGLMGGATGESGMTITWRDSDSINGLMDGSIQANTERIRSMASASTNGLMGESTKAIGP